MTTLAQCWKVTRKDATVFAFTDHDVDLLIGGVTYKSAIGFAPSAIDRSTKLETDNQTLSGLIDSSDITAADLRTGKWNGARVEIIEVDWSALTSERTLLVGFLGGVGIVGNQYRAELSSLEKELEKPLGRTVQLRCDADLGDTRCGYTLSADSSTITTVVSSLAFIDVAIVKADGYYNNGYLTWQTGSNAGLSFDIKRYVSATDTVELYEPVPYSMQIGDTVNLYRGCDRTMDTCKDTFSNIENFRGFPYVPGVKDLIGKNVS